jgi:signal transduction histidine kinase
MDIRELEVENENIRRNLSATLALSGYLLEANSEQAVIQAAMKVSTELLGADGSAFVPFNEWKHSLPVLTFGEADFLKSKEWQQGLTEPAIRHACRNCDQKQASAGCALLRGPFEGRNVFCTSLRCGGREIGVVSYFFCAVARLSVEQQQFLAEMVRLTDLALDALRAHAHELDSARVAFSPLGVKEELIALDEKNEDLLERLEYKAILDERTRLAREIHDGLAQTLAFLKIETVRMQAYLSKGDGDAVTRTLQACHKTLSEAYLDARQAIDNLRRIPDETLSDWLQMTAADFTTLTGTAVDASNVRMRHLFSPGEKAQLVRIVQEALTNIRKHAQASEIMLSAFERDEAVIMEVRDNGRGFSPEETQPASQYGLRSMRERAEAIGADFQIISTPGAGTTVRLRIPIRKGARL